MEIFDKDKRFIIPRKEVLKLNGSVCYNDAWRAWNTIRLKKDIIKEFPQLREKDKAVNYHMIYFRTHKELMKFGRSLKDKEVLPILLFFWKERD